MAYSHPKHFWTWFQRHSETLLKVHESDKKEEQYWMREINTHLRAFTKKLSFCILWNKKGDSSLAITTGKDPRYFDMAEKMAAKAPPLPGWKIFGLRPPNWAPQALFEEHLAEVGLDVHKCWFIPPEHTNSQGKYCLSVFVEIYTAINGEMEDALEQYIVNMLGEKTIGWEIAWIDLGSLFEREQEDKEKELIPIQRLPEFITCRNTRDFHVDSKGQLIVS